MGRKKNVFADRVATATSLLKFPLTPIKEKRSTDISAGKVIWSIFPLPLFVLFLLLWHSSPIVAQNNNQTYRHLIVKVASGSLLNATPVLETKTPLWAQHVSKQKWNWAVPAKNSKIPYFEGPIVYVIPPPEGSGEPFYPHNHEPAITWLKNGDLLVIWFSTIEEKGTEMTVLASRLRAGTKRWDSSSEFFKAQNRNMTGMSLYTDSTGKLYHFNSIGAEDAIGYANLAILMRSSNDNGITWTPPQVIAPKIQGRHQVIDGAFKTSDGTLILPCDANPGSALHFSYDNGKTWIDPGEGKPVPKFGDGEKSEGTIAGIHAHVVELKDGRLLAIGRYNDINGHMPMSISVDMGKIWTLSPSPFPPIAGGQRIVLIRLREGPILLVSFTNHPSVKGSMTFINKNDDDFQGSGMFAVVSYDDGKSWPVRKLLTPGRGEYDGGAWTGKFQATSTQAEPRGYLAATQTPDGIINLISSRLYYRFNLKWIETH